MQVRYQRNSERGGPLVEVRKKENGEQKNKITGDKLTRRIKIKANQNRLRFENNNRKITPSGTPPGTPPGLRREGWVRVPFRSQRCQLPSTWRSSPFYCFGRRRSGGRSPAPARSYIILIRSRLLHASSPAASLLPPTAAARHQPETSARNLPR